MQITKQDLLNIGACHPIVDEATDKLNTILNKQNESIDFETAKKLFKDNKESFFYLFLNQNKANLIKKTGNFTLGNYRILNKEKINVDDSTYLTFTNVNDATNQIAVFKQNFINKCIQGTTIELITLDSDNLFVMTPIEITDPSNVSGNFYVSSTFININQEFSNTNLNSLKIMIETEIENSWQHRIPIIEQEIIHSDGITSAWMKIE